MMHRLYQPPVAPRPANLDRGNWGQKYKDVSVRESVMSVKILVLGIFFVGILMLTVALIMGLEFPKYVRTKITEDQCIINTGHMKYDKWRLGELWTRRNRIYYFVLENENGFLYAGESPKVKQHGPYVYTETEEKYDVSFYINEVHYKIRRKYEFDAKLTQDECGDECEEYNELTVVNPQFLSRTSSSGGEFSFVISKMSSVVKQSLTVMHILLEDTSNTIEVTGCLDGICDTTWAAAQSLAINSDLTNYLSFGVWLRKNDAAYKTVILNDRHNVSFSQSEMFGLFDVILQPELLYGKVPMDRGMCQKWSEYITCASVDQPSLSSATLIDYQTNCGIVPLLQAFQTHQTSCLQNFTAVLHTFLCNKDTRCFNITGDDVVSSAYVMSLADFILSNLGTFVHNKMFIEPNMNLVITRNQSELALGYLVEGTNSETVFVHGVLNENWIGANVMGNPLWKLSTCLQDRDVHNNMLVREFNGSHLAPPSLLRTPHSTAYVSGHSEYVNTCGKLKACGSCLVPEGDPRIFVPELWRSAIFTTSRETSLHDVTVYRYYLKNDTFLVDSAYLVDSGLQNMTGLYGYLVWRSNPFFNDASSLYLDLGVSNESDRTGNLSFVCASSTPALHPLDADPLQTLLTSLCGYRVDPAAVWAIFRSNQCSTTGSTKAVIDVEPHTGRMWQKSFRFQFNVGVTPSNIDFPKSSPLNLTYLGLPIPVYWVDRSIMITNEEVDYFNYKVSRLMNVACGGLIGMMIVAVIIMILSVVVCFYPAKMNRVSPATEETSQSQNHR